MAACCRTALRAGRHAGSNASCHATKRDIAGFSFGRAKDHKGKSKANVVKPLIEQDDLFHPMSTSPIPAMREKAARIRKSSLSPLLRKPVAFDCKHSGWPTHATEAEWEEDQANHARYWPLLRQTNEDEHDLRSGRKIFEFDNMPEAQPYEEAVSMANWDVFLYTRGFVSMDTDRSLRHISKLLTYPITIGTILHENSPYSLRNQRLTHEGLRSLVALRQSLHPPLSGQKKPLVELTSPLKPLRIFCLGARAESSLPSSIWQQLCHLFPGIPLHIYFIGPEVIFPTPKAEPQASSGTGLRPATQFGVPAVTNIVSPWLTLTALQAPYEIVHESLGLFDPYRDVFFAFSPGFGFPSMPASEHPETGVPQDPIPQSQTNWHEALLQIMETKCALFCTGFSLADVERDVLALDQTDGVAGEFEWVLNPGENPFASLKVDVADFDYRVMLQTNWGVWAIKGKRYEVQRAEDVDYPEDGLVVKQAR